MPKDSRKITIGIDFGTSSIKCIWQDYADDRRYLISWGDEALGYPSYCLPSTIAAQSGKFYLGVEAEKLFLKNEAHCLVRSIKREVQSLFELKPLANKGKYKFKTADGRTVKVSSVYLGILLMGYAMGLSKKMVCEFYGERYDIRPDFNVAVPLDSLNHEIAEKQWERLAFIAEKASDRIVSGIDVATAMDLIDQISRDCVEIPPVSDRVTFVLPETAAAVITYFTSGIGKDGLFGIVDIGAGTTDVTFFRHFARPEELKNSFYAATTSPVGMDDFDMAMALAPHEDIRPQDSFQAKRIYMARQAKQKLNEVSEVRLGPKVVTLPEIEKRTEKMRADIYKSYKTTLVNAYKKEMRQNRWSSWMLFLIGGGTRLEMIRRQFREYLGDQIARPAINLMEIAEDIYSPSGGSIKLSEEMAALLAIAYGLSHSLVEWPQCWYPRQVDALPPVGVRKSYDWDDMYQK